MVIRLLRVFAVAGVVVGRVRSRSAAILEAAGGAAVVVGVAVLFGAWAWIAAGVALIAKSFELDGRDR